MGRDKSERNSGEEGVQAAAEAAAAPAVSRDTRCWFPVSAAVADRGAESAARVTRGCEPPTSTLDCAAVPAHRRGMARACCFRHAPFLWVGWLGGRRVGRLFLNRGGAVLGRAGLSRFIFSIYLMFMALFYLLLFFVLC